MLSGVFDHGSLVADVVTTVHDEVKDVGEYEGFSTDDDQLLTTECSVVVVEDSLVRGADESCQGLLLVNDGSFLVVEDESVVVVHDDCLDE